MEKVKVLNKAEVRNFKLFSKRSDIRKQQFPVCDLFDAYRNGNHSNDSNIAETLFPELKSNAFYRLKNRMIEDVNKSLMIINYAKDEKIHIHNLLALANIYKYKRAFSTAYQYFQQAEKKATRNDLLELLQLTYNEIITLSYEYTEIPLESYIEKKAKLTVQLQQFNKTKDFISVLSHRLKHIKIKKGDPVLEQLNEVLKGLEVEEGTIKSASLRFQINSIVRNILLQHKDYESMLTYLKEAIQEFEADGLFTKVNFKHKISMTVWIINSNIMLQRYTDVLALSEELKRYISEFNNLYYDRYIWSYYQSVFTAAFYLGEIDKCNQLIQEWRNEEQADSHSYYSLYMAINNIVVQYCRGDLKAASKAISKLMQPEILKSYSNEMRFNIILVDLILFFENKDYTYLQHRIKEVKRKYNHILKHPEMSRQKDFINILFEMTKDIDWRYNEALIQKINLFISETYEMNDGGKHINFDVWLDAKVKKVDYYSLLIQLNNASEIV